MLLLFAIHFLSLTPQNPLAQPLNPVDNPPVWHYTFSNLTTANVRPAFYDNTLRIFLRDQSNSSYVIVQTVDFFEFSDETAIQFPQQNNQSSTIDYVIFDNQGQSNLSADNAYPSLIAGSGPNIYSSQDNGLTFKISCQMCRQDSLKPGAEVSLSPTKDFWVSLTNNNRVATSRDLKTWLAHSNLAAGVKLNNIFPLNSIDNQTKWILVQKIEGRFPLPGSTYYAYYVGSLSYEQGFQQEFGPKNLTFGVDEYEISFATNGADVGSEKMMIITSGNTYNSPTSIFALFGVSAASPIPQPPFILNTPRRLLFKTINNIPMLVQNPKADFESKAKKVYRFSNEQISEENSLLLENVTTTSFKLLVEFNLGESKDVGVRVCKSEDGSEKTSVGYLIAEVFYVDRGESSSTMKQKTYRKRYDARQKPTLPSKMIHCLILGDGPLLEVYCDQYQIVFNLLIFPKSSSNRMELFSSRGTAILTKLELEQYD